MIDFGVGKWRRRTEARQPEMSTNGGGGGRQRAGKTPKQAIMLTFGAGGMAVATREDQNPENEHVLLVFGIGRLMGMSIYS
jgi:hypothetical protein